MLKLKDILGFSRKFLSVKLNTQTPTDLYPGRFSEEFKKAIEKSNYDLELDKLNEVCSRYRRILSTAFVDEALAKLPNGTVHHTTTHLKFMLSEISDRDGNMSLTKRHRWLGYVQGTMILAGLITVQDERNATRNLFDGS